MTWVADRETVGDKGKKKPGLGPALKVEQARPPWFHESWICSHSGVVRTVA